MALFHRSLREELERNLEIAQSTRNMLRNERDMLQGDVKQRLVLYQFHTDVWEMLVHHGSFDDLPDTQAVTACYMRLKEANELIEKFNQEGDAIVHSPLVYRSSKDYGRDHVVELLEELCEEAQIKLQEAYQVVEGVIDRTCPACDNVFDSVEAMDSHQTEEHRPGR